MKRTRPPARRAPLRRRAGALERRPMKVARPKRVVGKADAAAAFRLAVLAEPCVMCGDEHQEHEAHHAVEAQVLRRICRSMGMSDVEALAIVYDPAFGVALCGASSSSRCHERHTNAVARVPRDLLPERVFVAAYELDSGRPGEEALMALEREHP